VTVRRGSTVCTISQYMKQLMLGRLMVIMKIGLMFGVKILTRKTQTTGAIEKENHKCLSKMSESHLQ